MPRVDETGPAGVGSMTGWGFGPCGNKEKVAAKELKGRGIGNRRGMRCGRGADMGCGRGLGFGGWVGPGIGCFRISAEEMNDETRKMNLQQQRALLKTRLDTIDKRLETL